MPPPTSAFFPLTSPTPVSSDGSLASLALLTSAAVSSPVSPATIIPRREPWERMWRVSARVSTPLMPGMSWRFRYSSRVPSLPQCEGAFECCRTTRPETQGRTDWS